MKAEVVENFRPMRVVVIGAGFSGIAAAIRIPERLRNVELVVYEKEAGVGGVWWMNKYPGVACDIPSHSYQYTFAPNPRWSSLYAPGSEIQQYLEDVATRFGAMRFVKLKHRVDQCVWDEQVKKWKITVTKIDEDETFEDIADFIIAARGALNVPAMPDIPGLDKFEGKVMHSAAWDTDYDFRNKRIGIIGNGSSAIQIIPSLQKVEGAELVCFMRTPTWISGQFGEHAMVALGHDATKVDFTPAEQEAFAADPKSYLRMRKVIEDAGNTIHESTVLGSPMQTLFAEGFRTSMAERLRANGGHAPHLEDVVRPTFAPGCRRLTPGPGFLEALGKENVRVVVGQDIASIQNEGNGKGKVILASGEAIGGLDVLVCATGFKVSSGPAYSVVGRNGVTLSQRWGTKPESYLSVFVDGFPNYAMMLGPNSAIGFGSLTVILESEADYACKVVRKLQKEGYACADVRAERVRDFQRFVTAYFKGTVYVDKCRSWYKGDGGKGPDIIALWPGSTLHALEVLRSPRWEDFTWDSLSDSEDDGEPNALAWLVNGWSICETEGDPSWYLNEDEVDVPLEGRPEDKKRYKARPWSY